MRTTGALICVFVTTFGASGSHLYWSNSSGGVYGVKGNWTPTATPSGNVVHFELPNTYSVTFDDDYTSLAGWFETGVVRLELDGHTLTFFDPSDGLPLGSFFTIGFAALLTDPTLVVTDGVVHSVHTAIHVNGGWQVGSSTSHVIVTEGGRLDMLEDIIVGFSGTDGSLALLTVVGDGQAHAGDQVRIGKHGAAGGWDGTACVSGASALLSADGEVLVGQSGRLELAGGSCVTAGKEVNVRQYGALIGAGYIDAPLVLNRGRVEPAIPAIGSSLSLEIDGDFEQEGTGELATQISAAGHAHLSISGDVVLDGELEVGVGMYTPAPGSQFRIIDAASVQGAFATTSLPTLSGCSEFRVVYSCAGEVWLLVRTDLDGDADFDGDVDMADLNIAISQYQQNGCLLTGDVNYDGVVDSADINIIVGNFNTSC